ncbi:MAG: alpha/beta hydrolase [Frankia sp.]|nr:alpha/beta hydrolase [Frankia sp.]
MRLDPPVQQFRELNLREREFLRRLDVPAQRRYLQLLLDLNFLRFSRPGPEVHDVTDHLVAVAGGEIRVRLYRPSAAAPLPAHLSLHGGGWWQGSIDDLIVDALCRQRAQEGGVVVASVDYRLAPEHPYPTGLDDAWAALTWLVGNADGLGVDAGNVSVGGNSAGANLAAALALRARDAGGPPLVLQLLEVPALDLTLETARRAAAASGSQDMTEQLAVAVAHYLPNPRDARQPLVSPLFADDLAGLPPAVIMTAEHDPLRLDGELYATRLAEAGVATRHLHQAGALHGSPMLTGTWEPAARWQQEVVTALRQAHHEQRAGAATR